MHTPLAASASARSASEFVVELVARYGDVVRYFNPYGEVYFFNHPDHVQSVIQSANYQRERLVTMILGKGLLSSDGDLWRTQRRLMTPHFSDHCLLGFARVITETTLAAFHRWDELHAGESSMDVAFEMRRLTLDVIVRALFSVELDGKLDALSDAVTTLIEDLGTITGTLFNVNQQISPARNAKFQNAMRCVDEFAYGLIAERRSLSKMPRDLLTVLLQSKDTATGQPLDDKQLRDEVVTMLIAGHETTAITLGWALHLLTQNPGASSKLDTELDKALGGRTPTHEDLIALSYTRMVIEETMRLNPPVWFMMRRSVVETEIAGYSIPADASVLVCAFTTHRHKDFWEDPERFDPERFSPERSQGRHRYAHFPFSGGRHHCLGHGFAMMEAQLILAMIMQRWRLLPSLGHVVDPNPALTLRQRAGFLASMTRR